LKINAITFSLILASLPTLGETLPLLVDEKSTNETLQNTQTPLIEQITITATRTEKKLSTLDRNLSVIASDEISFINQQHINQSIVRVPGGWISRGNGQEHLTAIRSPVLTGAGGCGAFYIAQDGISLRAPGFCNANQLFDTNTEQAARIEVLRGPSSTLYGSNAVHGVINVITQNPFEQSRDYVGATFGVNDYVSAQFSVGTAEQQHGFMVTGNASHDGGYKDDSGFEQQKLNVVHQFQDDHLTIKNVLTFTNLNQETAGFIKGEEAYKDDSLKRENPNPEAFRDNKTFKAYSKISYELDDSSTVSITPYLRMTDMAFLQHFLPWQSLEENSQKGFGFKSQYEKHYQTLTWLIGADVDFTRGELTETQVYDFSPTIPQGKHYDYDVQAKVYSPFAKVHWAASDNLSLNAGMRYEFTEYDYNNKLSNGSACDIGVTNCRFTRPEDQKTDFDEVSYQLGGHYQLNSLHTLYGQYSTGYRAPQATELFRLQAGQNVTDLKPEHVDSIEVGLRGQTENVFYDASVFSMNKKHFIFQDTNRQNISNGETSHNGVEFVVGYQLPKGFYVRANGTIASHTYDNSLTLSLEDIKGNEIDTAPQHMGSMQVGWHNGQAKKIELEWVHLGNYHVNPENTAEYKGHNLLNLRASTTINKQWTMSARILNIANEDYAERADFGFGSYRYFVGEPRSVFVSLKYKFD
jgi:outer membrane receptor protein involved in Fe transport